MPDQKEEVQEKAAETQELEEDIQEKTEENITSVEETEIWRRKKDKKRKKPKKVLNYPWNMLIFSQLNDSSMLCLLPWRIFIFLSLRLLKSLDTNVTVLLVIMTS